MLEFNQEQSGRKTLFVEVILPLAISKTYTYRIPFEMNADVAIGKRAVVQFGKSKIYTAIVYRISEDPPVLYDAKYIIEILDDEPIVNILQIQFWEWIADYYLCNLGEVMQAALPAALKLASETRVILLKDAEFNKDDLSDKEFLIIDALDIQSELKIGDISKLLGQKTVFPILKSLFDKGIIHISEEVTERYKPRIKPVLILNTDYEEPESKRALFEVLERAPRQLDALMAYMKLSREKSYVFKNEVIEASNCGSAAIKALLDKRIFIQEERIVSRLNENDEELQSFVLSDVQKTALSEIDTHFKEKDVVLLHGVTSSGKTQIYIRLIEEMLNTGRQVLYLLPEIALTTQIIERLRKYFGNAIGVYHSKFSDNERAEVWNKVLKGDYQVILGARSAVFLPFADLGMIVVDEEHETSYKQFDPAPRYHARDAAIYLAHIHSAKVLLGSATPALESYFNTKMGKYGLVELLDRFGGANLPKIEVVSLTEETKRKTMQSHFTSVLIDEIKQALERKEQVILFQNRRGYTPFLLCRTCGYSPKCINCDVSLTYHKSSDKLHCHYCGFKQDPVAVCPACGSTHIEQKGFGTEKIEDELSLIFPDARISRMDLDTTRSKNSFQNLITNFEDQKIDIMVGTQMVAKGLDFDRVTVIGIISADSLLNYPDFRAYERSFQLLSQVAGRAGRRDMPGKVIIQAYDIKHRILNQVIGNNYHDLFSTEIVERKNFHYPPFYRIIQLDVKHKDFHQLNFIADRIAAELRKVFGERVIGPEFPLVGRIRNYYIKTIMLKNERTGISMHKIKEVLKNILLKIETDKDNKGVYIQVDVDPF